MKKFWLICFSVVFLGSSKIYADHITPFIKAFIEVPSKIKSFNSDLFDSSKKTAELRKALGQVNIDPNQSQKIITDIESEINKLEDKFEGFKKGSAVSIVANMNKECGGPLIGVMAIPGIGQAVSAMCSKMASLDLKISCLYERAETALSNLLSARDFASKKLDKTTMSIEVSQVSQASLEAQAAQLAQLAQATKGAQDAKAAQEAQLAEIAKELKDIQTQKTEIEKASRELQIQKAALDAQTAQNSNASGNSLSTNAPLQNTTANTSVGNSVSSAPPLQTSMANTSADNVTAPTPSTQDTSTSLDDSTPSGTEAELPSASTVVLSKDDAANLSPADVSALQSVLSD
jgi:archaellum component FlaC